MTEVSADSDRSVKNVFTPQDIFISAFFDSRSVSPKKEFKGCGIVHLQSSY